MTLKKIIKKRIKEIKQHIKYYREINPTNNIAEINYSHHIDLLEVQKIAFEEILSELEKINCNNCKWWEKDKYNLCLDRYAKSGFLGFCNFNEIQTLEGSYCSEWEEIDEK